MADTPSPPGPPVAALFPTELDPGPALDRRTILAFSRTAAPLYAALAGSIAEEQARAQALHPDAARVFARRAVVPLAHFFLDRLLRLDRALARRPEGLAVPDAPRPRACARVSEFQALAVSCSEFNHGMMAELAELYRLRRASASGAQDTALRAAGGSLNHNFTGATAWRRIGRRARRLAVRWLGTLAPRAAGRIPALSMGYDANPLMERGLYGFNGLADLAERFEAPPVPALDAGLRAAVLKDRGGALARALREWLSGMSAGSPELRESASALFTDFIERMYPRSLLEGAPRLLEACLRELRRYPGPLLLAEIGDDRSIGMIAAAKALGRTVIGCQHGGIYGTLEDIANAQELEYAVCDRFITWGWTRFPDHPACASVQAVPLPSPWLSERAAFWRRRRPALSARREADMLLMSNKVYPYPPAPSGADVSRSDHAAAFAESLKALVREASRAGQTILHKPYNQTTTALLRRSFAELDAIGRGTHALIDTADKGLTPELVSRARLVVWDQPASGFMECLAGGLPSLVYWPRAYNAERAEARDAIASLESAGLIHREPSSLCREVALFKEGPRAWLEQPARRRAVEAFQRGFAWVDEAWAARWKEFLSGL